MNDVQGSANCVGCGYDLLGGSADGLCPECGRRYDRQTGLGIASSLSIAQDRGDRVLLWMKVGGVVLLGLLSIGAGIWGALRTGDWNRPIVISGGVAIALFAVAGLIWWTDALDRRQR